MRSQRQDGVVMSGKKNGSIIDIKSHRLCRAAERVVASVMVEQAELTGCVLMDVVPLSAGRVVARIAAPSSTVGVQWDVLWSAVHSMKARCRVRLAVLLNRKRTPEVEFELLPIISTEPSGSWRRSDAD